MRAAELLPPSRSTTPTRSTRRSRRSRPSVYQADGVDFSPVAPQKIEQFTRDGLGNLSICMAKSHLSLSADPALVERADRLPHPGARHPPVHGRRLPDAALRGHHADAGAGQDAGRVQRRYRRRREDGWPLLTTPRRGIKNDVIVRYLTGEKQSQDIAQMALTPKNYKFKYKGEAERNGYMVHVFQVSPRKKMVGLYKGELWVDARTYLPVREAGRFVKNPSVFLKKIEFVRDYEIKDGVAFPHHIESRVDTRFWGPANMSISFSNVVRQTGDQVTAVPVQVSQ